MKEHTPTETKEGKTKKTMIQRRNRSHKQEDRTAIEEKLRSEKEGEENYN